MWSHLKRTLFGGLLLVPLAACAPPFNKTAYDTASLQAVVATDHCLHKDGPLHVWRIQERMTTGGAGEATLITGADDDPVTRDCLLDVFGRLRVPPFSGPGITSEFTLREGDPSVAGPPGVVPALPTQASLKLALSPALLTAQRCLPAASPPARVAVVVDRSGEVSGVYLGEGLVADSREGACIISAFRAAGHVPPFTASSVTLSFTVRGNPAP